MDDSYRVGYEKHGCGVRCVSRVVLSMFISASSFCNQENVHGSLQLIKMTSKTPEGESREAEKSYPVPRMPRSRILGTGGVRCACRVGRGCGSRKLLVCPEHLIRPAATCRYLAPR